MAHSGQEPELATQIEQLKQILEKSERVVFFGGAGVSTESGLPDFRSDSSREKTLQNYGTNPEQILSSDYFYAQPEEFYRYVKNELHHPNVKPNKAHEALADLEKQGKLAAIITQNIDGLHQDAGNTKVYELHGSLNHYTCVDCAQPKAGSEVETELLAAEDGFVPQCTCGGTLKPDVVLYGEQLPEAAVGGASEALSEADTLIVAGTSLAVYPAAALLSLFQGENLVVINLTPTPADLDAQLLIQAPVGTVMRQAVATSN